MISFRYCISEGIGDDNWGTSSVFAQEEDLLHQLLWGVRFLDIRAGFYPTTPERFWLVHGPIKTHPMIEGIEDVKTFLRNTQEIMIWEINGFEQPWDDEAHAEYKELLVSEFSDWLVSPGELAWNTPLSDIWNREDLASGQGRIIITYNLVEYTDYDFFFPEIRERWGNVDKAEDLYNYLSAEVRNIQKGNMFDLLSCQVENARNNAAYQPWKPNCQLTPTTTDIIVGGINLRDFAEAVNRSKKFCWRKRKTYISFLEM